MGKYPDPILVPSYYWDYQLVASSIVKLNGSYYLYYTGRNMPNYLVGVAVSADGINFTKYSGNPILSHTQQWEVDGVLDANVINDNGVIENGLYEFKWIRFWFGNFF